jgi:hypothetical protein
MGFDHPSAEDSIVVKPFRLSSMACTMWISWSNNTIALIEQPTELVDPDR